jgi:hypothetical protein
VELPSWTTFVPPFADGIPHLTEPARLLAQSLKRERELVADARRYRFLASLHECNAAYLSRNEFAGSYGSARQELEYDPLGTYEDVTPEMRAKMIEMNSIWCLQVYPNTPVGFNIYHAATLDEVIDEAIPSPPEEK